MNVNILQGWEIQNVAFQKIVWMDCIHFDSFVKQEGKKFCRGQLWRNGETDEAFKDHEVFKWTTEVKESGTEEVNGKQMKFIVTMSGSKYYLGEPRDKQCEFGKDSANRCSKEKSDNSRLYCPKHFPGLANSQPIKRKLKLNSNKEIVSF